MGGLGIFLEGASKRFRKGLVLDVDVCGERVNPKSEEIKRVVWREEGCGNDFVDGNLQCRRS